MTAAVARHLSFAILIHHTKCHILLDFLEGILPKMGQQNNYLLVFYYYIKQKPYVIGKISDGSNSNYISKFL
jgi:hypothetical protein